MTFRRVFDLWRVLHFDTDYTSVETKEVRQTKAVDPISYVWIQILTQCSLTPTFNQPVSLNQSWLLCTCWADCCALLIPLDDPVFLLDSNKRELYHNDLLLPGQKRPAILQTWKRTHAPITYSSIILVKLQKKKKFPLAWPCYNNERKIVFSRYQIKCFEIENLVVCKFNAFANLSHLCIQVWNSVCNWTCWQVQLHTEFDMGMDFDIALT